MSVPSKLPAPGTPFADPKRCKHPRASLTPIRSTDGSPMTAVCSACASSVPFECDHHQKIGQSTVSLWRRRGRSSTEQCLQCLVTRESETDS